MRPAVFRSGPGTAVLAALLIGWLADGAVGAEYPSWWTSRGVVNTNATVTNDYAVANVGHLKWFATNACDELEANLPGGAGTNLPSLVSTFSSSNNHVAVNIGQVKAVAAVVYDRLIEKDYTDSYPWTTNITADDSDFAAANLGQLKNVFDFDLTLDSDSDGLPDWWEIAHKGVST